MERIFNDTWDEDDCIQFKPQKIKVKKRDKKKSNTKPGAFVLLKPQIKKEKISKIIKKNDLNDKKNKKKLNKIIKGDNKIVKQVTQQNGKNPISNKNGKKSIAEKLRESLEGPRFRYLNEMLYTIDGNKAMELFKNDKEAFIAYHSGYRYQVKQWPLNPLNRIIRSIQKMPKNFTIADFGCGDGKLAESVSHKVYSIDLVSSKKDVIACDMANTPLESKSINIAVYCLSLMGSNLKDFLLEANRVLANDGQILIAEIASRFDDINQFITNVKMCGFDLLRKDIQNSMFYFFTFKKVKNISKKSIIKDFSLKPCLYKKR